MFSFSHTCTPSLWVTHSPFSLLAHPPTPHQHSPSPSFTYPPPHTPFASHNLFHYTPPFPLSLDILPSTYIPFPSQTLPRALPHSHTLSFTCLSLTRPTKSHALGACESHTFQCHGFSRDQTTTLAVMGKVSGWTEFPRPSEAGRLGRPWPPRFFRKLLKFELWILNNFNGTVSFTHSSIIVSVLDLRHHTFHVRRCAILFSDASRG